MVQFPYSLLHLLTWAWFSSYHFHLLQKARTLAPFSSFSLSESVMLSNNVDEASSGMWSKMQRTDDVPIEKVLRRHSGWGSDSGVPPVALRVAILVTSVIFPVES